MKILQVVLSNLIRAGKVTVETPNLDMSKLSDAVWNYALEVLEEIEESAYKEAMTDAEKVERIQECLERTA